MSLSVFYSLTSPRLSKPAIEYRLYSNYLGAETENVAGCPILEPPSSLRKESVSLDCKVESTQNNCPNKFLKKIKNPQKKLKQNDHNM